MIIINSLCIITIFLNFIKNKYIKYSVLTALILNIIGSMSFINNNLFLIISYIVLFITTPFLIIEKFKQPCFEGYKPLKYIFIYFGVLCFGVSIFYTNDISALLFLQAGVMTISNSCFENNLYVRKKLIK